MFDSKDIFIYCCMINYFGKVDILYCINQSINPSTNQPNPGFCKVKFMTLSTTFFGFQGLQSQISIIQNYLYLSNKKCTYLLRNIWAILCS